MSYQKTGTRKPLFVDPVPDIVLHYFWNKRCIKKNQERFTEIVDGYTYRGRYKGTVKRYFSLDALTIPNRCILKYGIDMATFESLWSRDVKPGYIKSIENDVRDGITMDVKESVVEEFLEVERLLQLSETVEMTVIKVSINGVEVEYYEELL